MTKTENFALNQWDAGDLIRREDFNADNQRIDAALAAGTKVVWGSYVGTGEIEEKHPVVINFDFAPKMVIVFADKGQNYFVIFLPGENNYFPSHTSSSCFGYIICTNLNGNTLRYYGKTDYSGSNTAKVQGNELGKTYQYIALG